MSVNPEVNSMPVSMGEASDLNPGTEIVGDQRVLTRTRRFGPTLISGLNSAGKTLIYCLAEMDYHRERAVYIIVSVTEAEHGDFLAGRTSFKTLLQNSPALYRATYEGENGNVVEIKLSDIPENEMPTDESFLTKEALNLQGSIFE